MGSVGCATKRIGYPDQGLIQKIHQMPFCKLVFKFMDISLFHVLSSLLLFLLPQYTPTCSHTFFLDGVKGKFESTLIMSLIKIRQRRFLKGILGIMTMSANALQIKTSPTNTKIKM